MKISSKKSRFFFLESHKSQEISSKKSFRQLLDRNIPKIYPTWLCRMSSLRWCGEAGGDAERKQLCVRPYFYEKYYRQSSNFRSAYKRVLQSDSTQRKSESLIILVSDMSNSTINCHIFSEIVIFFLRAIFSDPLHLWMPKMDS